jgi:hypothetical protein
MALVIVIIDEKTYNHPALTANGWRLVYGYALHLDTYNPTEPGEKHAPDNKYPCRPLGRLPVVVPQTADDPLHEV